MPSTCGQSGRHSLGDLGCRSDGVAGKEAAAGQNGSFSSSIVSQQEMFTGQEALVSHDFHSILFIDPAIVVGRHLAAFNINGKIGAKQCT